MSNLFPLQDEEDDDEKEKGDVSNGGAAKSKKKKKKKKKAAEEGGAAGQVTIQSHRRISVCLCRSYEFYQRLFLNLGTTV